MLSLIHILAYEVFEGKLQELDRASKREVSQEEIRRLVKELVPEYRYRVVDGAAERGVISDLEKMRKEAAATLERGATALGESAGKEGAAEREAKELASGD